MKFSEIYLGYVSEGSLKRRETFTWNMKCCRGASIRRVAYIRKAARVVVSVRRPDAYLTGDFEKLVRRWHSGGIGVEYPLASVLPRDRRLGVPLGLACQHHLVPLCSLLYVLSHCFIPRWGRIR